MMGALDNIVVADFSHVFAGPYCTVALADMGAEVIKIESPYGDAARGYTAPDLKGESPSFLLMNRNKKSIVLDLGTAEGRSVARDIVKRADVVVENFSSGVMKRLGLDYETMSQFNPALIYCSISAYGRTGEYADRAGYDPVIQAETGVMSLNGDSDGPPYRTGVAFIDLCTGMFASQAILAALYARTSSNEGQFIDVPLFDTGICMAGYHMMSYLASGTHPGRQGNGSIVVAPMGLFEALDGQFFITVAGDKVWEKLVKALGDPSQLQKSSYDTNALRVKNTAELSTDLQNIFSMHTVQHWIDRFQNAGVPAGPVRSIGEAVNAPETIARGIIGEIEHSSAGIVPNIRFPMHMSRNPLTSSKGAPLLGEHNLYVLSKFLHYSSEYVDELDRRGTFGKTLDSVS